MLRMGVKWAYPQGMVEECKQGAVNDGSVNTECINAGSMNTLLPLTLRKVGTRTYKLFPSLFNQVPAQPSTFDETILPRTMAALQGNRAEAYLCIKQLNKDIYSANAGENINDKIIAAGIIPLLTECLGDCIFGTKDPAFLYEGAGLLGNIAAGTMAQTAALVAGGCVDILISMLLQPQCPIAIAVWALGNIAADGFGPIIIEAGIYLPPLAFLKSSKDIAIITAGAFCISQLIVYKNSLPDTDRGEVYGIVRHLLLQDLDVDTFVHLCKTIDKFLEYGWCDLDDEVRVRLISLLHHWSVDVVISALSPVKHIVSKLSVDTQLILARYMLPQVIHLLRERQTIETEDMETIYLVIAGIIGLGADHLEAVVDSDIFPIVCKALESETYKVGKKVSKAFKDALAVARPEQIVNIGKTGFFTILVSYGQTPNRANEATNRKKRK